MEPSPSAGFPGFDADFDLARRAVEAGLLTEAQVEAAMLAQEREPKARLADLLPLPEDALRALRPPSARALPPEVLEAMKDPANRCGAYWVVRKLSEGGMGEVFRGWDGRLGRWVALKFPKRSESLEARERFVREAGLVARLEHPNVARVYEVGEAAGRPFLAMEFVEGRTLAEALRGAGRDQVLEWVRQAAAGVGAAHAAGVIHRDLKPGNIMLDGAGRAVVLDFGLARATDVGDSIPGGSRVVAGTPNYMAPEQALGRSDPRSDVYGLGAVLYEAVTGRPPFVGETAAEVLLQVANREPVPPRKLVPGMSRDCEAIVLKCLEKDPARRYAGTAELVEDIEACLKREPLPRARRRTALYVLEKSVRRQPLPWLLAALVLALLAGAGVGGLAWLRSPGTIRLAVTPAGARVHIGERTWQAGDGPLALDLPAGVVEVRVEAPEHEPRTLPVLVRRRHAQDLRVDLEHEKGQLEASADPADASIEVDGVEYGARIRGLALDTGLHRLRVSAPGHFEREREVVVRRGVVTRADFGLEAGELWRLRDDAVQVACTLKRIGDRDGDGVEDLAAQDLTEFRLLSGATGADLGRIRASGGPQWTMGLFDLGDCRVLAGWGDGTEGLRVTLLFIGEEPAVKELVWNEPGAAYEVGLSAELRLGPDLDGDGRREFVVAGRGGGLWVLDARTGAARRIAVADPRVRILALAISGTLALYAGPAGEGEEGAHIAGAVSLESGAPAWSWTRPTRRVFAADFEDPPGPVLMALGRDRWQAFDGRTGTLRWEGGAMADDVEARFEDLDQDGRADALLGFGPRRLFALSVADGREIWGHTAGGRCEVWAGPEGTILCLAAGRLDALDRADGRLRWSAPASGDSLILTDFDRDGRAEIVTGGERERLDCFSAGGRPLWSLRMRGSPRPAAFLPTRQGGFVACCRGSSFVGAARAPRELWHAVATGPLIAPPACARLPAGGAVVAQQGDWGDGTSVHAFDARHGTFLQAFGRGAPPNFPPGVADMDGDGEEDFLGWTDAGPGGIPGLQVRRAGDGGPLTFFPSTLQTDLYAIPVAADFDADGALDVAVNLRLGRHLVVYSGRTAACLWQRDLGGESWGGLAAGDLDGDSRPDLVVPADRRPLRAFRGHDGQPLWEQMLVHGTRTPPVLVPPRRKAAPILLAVTADGTLHALDGGTGASLASRPCGACGAPAFLPGASPLLLVPRGPDGLQALSFPSLAPLWSASSPLDATPTLADLDGDGRTEAVCATREGVVEVFDAAGGRLLWSHAVSREGCVAPAALCDLDGDGCADILVADRAGRLTAISGEPTRAARR